MTDSNGHISLCMSGGSSEFTITRGQWSLHTYASAWRRCVCLLLPTAGLNIYHRMPITITATAGVGVGIMRQHPLLGLF